MISIKDVSKSYSDEPQVEVFRKIGIDIRRGEIVALFGPNGSGKTTLLNMIAGIDNDFEGSIEISKKPVGQSRIGVVFQNIHDSIFPWRTVLENVVFGLEMEGMAKDKREGIAEKYLKIVRMLEHKDKYAYQLSGGLKQLTSICRALAFNPDVLLLDEPFSSLDYHTSRETSMHFLRLWRKTKKTTLLISHDVDEAVLLADRVVVLSPKPGRIRTIVKVNLARPRRLEMMKERGYVKIRNQVLSSFLGNGGVS